MSEEEETQRQETHKNGSTRQLLFRLQGYKSPERRGYWSSARILLKNHRKCKGSKMEIFENGAWQSLSVKRCEAMAKIEEEARQKKKE